MIEIRGLGKSFPGRRGNPGVKALEGVNLTVRDDEFLTVLGPSGCGKTTLLRCLAGLVSWDEGEILLDRRPVTGPGPERAMVFQSIALMPWASVLRNVTFGLELRGVNGSDCRSRAQELIELVGLSGFESSMPFELSGGMQQRVGLARALAVEPAVLLMDEPFGALDEQTRRLLQEELLQIWETRRTTVVFITHSMDEAVLLGDRVVLMSARPGKIEDVVEVPMPRPRSAHIDTVEGSAEFREITSQLWVRLREWQVDIGRRGRAAAAGSR